MNRYTLRHSLSAASKINDGSREFVIQHIRRWLDNFQPGAVLLQQSLNPLWKNGNFLNVNFFKLFQGKQNSNLFSVCILTILTWPAFSTRTCKSIDRLFRISSIAIISSASIESPHRRVWKLARFN